MSNHREGSSHLLRPEARPVQWTLLTAHQQSGLGKLLNSLNAAVEHLDEPKPPNSGLPWMEEERHSQLIFIDGKRGTGKTTLMLSLVRLLSDSGADEGFHEATDILDVARKIRNRVVVLEPLDMEPMPVGTPILSAILARLNQATNRIGLQGNRARRGMLDSSLKDEPEYVRFKQIQARIARALDGNLESRKGRLDREQFGSAVLEQEDDRLMLPKLLSESLDTLSRSLPAGTPTIDGDHCSTGADPRRRLFLVPIDDVDLNPGRCLELLRLLRHYSVPQFFFLLMGQRDLIESIVKLKISVEFSDVADPDNSLSAVSSDELQKALAQVAVANLQKQIPTEITLPEIPLNSVFDFKPLPGGTAGVSEQPTLGDLLAQVPISDPGVPLGNLRELLSFGIGTSDIPKTAGDFRRKQYPGLGALEVAPRRLIDLWRRLAEVIHSNKDDEDDLKREVLEVFTMHWERIVDEDPRLSRENREKLRREGIDACTVISDADPEPESCNEYSIEGVRGPGGDKRGPAQYRPVLRVGLSLTGTGVPRIRFRGQGPDAIEIEEPRTRCAYVLMHDLQRVLISDECAIETARPPMIRAPISVSWVSDTGGVRWPVPPLPTFLRQTHFLQSLSAWDRLEQNGSNNQVSQNSLRGFYYQWIAQGTSLLSGENTELSDEPRWGEWIQSLKSLVDSRAVPQALMIKWLSDLALLSMPEACGMQLAIRATPDGMGSPVQDAVEHFERLFGWHKPELLVRRKNRLDPLWDRHPVLWRFLNSHPEDKSWIQLRVDEPERETTAQLRSDVGELTRQIKRQNLLTRFTSLVREATSVDESRSGDERPKEPSEKRMRRIEDVASQLLQAADNDEEFVSTVISELEQAAELLSDTPEFTTRIKLREYVVELSQSSVDGNDADHAAWLLALRYGHLGDELEDSGRYKAALSAFETSNDIARQILEEAQDDRNNHWLVGVSYINIGRIHVMLRQYERAQEAIEAAIRVRQSIVKNSPDDTQAQRDLGAAYSWIGGLHLEAGRPGDAYKAFVHRFRIAKKVAEDDADSLLAQRDVSSACGNLGQAYLDLGSYESAEEEFQNGLEIGLSLVEKEPDNIGFLEEVSALYRLLGAALLEQRRPEEAIAAFSEAVTNSQRLVEKSPHNLEYLFSVSASQCRVGQACLESGRRDEALMALTNALSPAEALADQVPMNSSYQLNLASCQFYLSRLHSKSERRELEDAAWRLIKNERIRGGYFAFRYRKAEEELKAAIESRKPVRSRRKKRPAKKKATGKRRR